MALLTYFIIAIITIKLVTVNSDCGVVPRQWNNIVKRVEYLARPVDLVVVHQHATGEALEFLCDSDESCRNFLVNYKMYTITANSYRDVGYAFVIGDHGVVYECMGWYRIGMHALGFDRKSIGILFIGNFKEKQPTPQSLEALKQLLDCGVKRGHLSENYRIATYTQLHGSMYRSCDCVKAWCFDDETKKDLGLQLFNNITGWSHAMSDAEAARIYADTTC